MIDEVAKMTLEFQARVVGLDAIRDIKKIYNETKAGHKESLTRAREASAAAKAAAQESSKAWESSAAKVRTVSQETAKLQERSAQAVADGNMRAARHYTEVWRTAEAERRAAMRETDRLAAQLRASQKAADDTAARVPHAVRRAHLKHAAHVTLLAGMGTGILAGGLALDSIREATKAEDAAGRLQSTYGIRPKAMAGYTSFVESKGAELLQNQVSMYDAIGKAQKSTLGPEGVKRIVEGSAKLSAVFKTNFGSTVSGVTALLNAMKVKAKDVPGVLDAIGTAAKRNGGDLSTFLGPQASRIFMAGRQAGASPTNILGVVSGFGREFPGGGGRAMGVIATLLANLSNPSSTLMKGLPIAAGLEQQQKAADQYAQRQYKAGLISYQELQARKGIYSQDVLHAEQSYLSPYTNFRKFGVQGVIRNLMKMAGNDPKALRAIFGGGMSLVTAREIGQMGHVGLGHTSGYLNTAFGQVSKETPNQFKAMQLSIEDMEVSIGKGLIPMLKSFLGVVNPMVHAVSSWVEHNRSLVDTMIKAGIVVGIASAATRGLMGAWAMLTTGWTAATKVIGFFRDSLILTRIQLIVLEAQQIATAVATRVMTGAQWLLNVAMDANPIMLVVTALALVGVGFYEAYQHITPFRNAVNAAGNAVKRFGSWVVSEVPKVFGTITHVIGGVVNWVKHNWQFALFAALTGPFAPIVIAAKLFGPQLLSAIGKPLGSVLTATRKWGENLLHTGVNALTGMVNWVKHNWPSLILTAVTAPFVGPISLFFMTTLPQRLFTWAVNGVLGYIHGLKSMAGALVSQVTTSFYNGFRYLWSDLPAKMLTWGGKAVTGFVNGIKAKIGDVGNVAHGILNAVTGWLGFNSPNKYGIDFYVYGANAMGPKSGFAAGITSQKGNVAKAAQQIAKTAANGLNDQHDAWNSGAKTADAYVQGFKASIDKYGLGTFQASNGMIGYLPTLGATSSSAIAGIKDPGGSGTTGYGYMFGAGQATRTPYADAGEAAYLKNPKGTIYDTDFAATHANLKLPGNSKDKWYFEGAIPYTSSGGVGNIEEWKSPGGGQFAFLHLNTMGGGNRYGGRLIQGKPYYGEDVVGITGGQPGVDPGVSGKYSTGYHLCVVTDENGRKFLAYLSSGQQQQAKANGSTVTQVANNPYKPSTASGSSGSSGSKSSFLPNTPALYNTPKQKASKPTALQAAQAQADWWKSYNSATFGGIKPEWMDPKTRALYKHDTYEQDKAEENAKIAAANAWWVHTAGKNSALRSVYNMKLGTARNWFKTQWHKDYGSIDAAPWKQAIWHEKQSMIDLQRSVAGVNPSSLNAHQQQQWLATERKIHEKQREIWDQEARIVAMQTGDWSEWQKRKKADAQWLANQNRASAQKIGGGGGYGPSGKAHLVSIVGRCAAEAHANTHRQKTANNTEKTAEGIGKLAERAAQSIAHQVTHISIHRETNTLLHQLIQEVKRQGKSAVHDQRAGGHRTVASPGL